MKQAYLDCYVVYDDKGIIIGNKRIERAYRFVGDALAAGALMNKQSGYHWDRQEQTLLLSGDTVQGTVRSRSFSAEVRNHDGLSLPYLSLTVTSSYTYGVQEREFAVHPGLPFITTHARIKGKWERSGDKQQKAELPGIERESTVSTGTFLSVDDAIDIFSLPQTHLKVTTVNLYDKTDENDTLLSEHTRVLYPRGEYDADGNLFLFEDYLRGESLLVVKDAPAPSSMLERTAPDLLVHGNQTAELIGSGLREGEVYENFVSCYGSIVGVGDSQTLLRLFKRYYNHEYAPLETANMLMANTWGDRSQDEAISENFIRGEILAAEEIGIDLLQIDDGWQLGTTPNSRLSSNGVWSGYYQANENFWSVHPRKFPEGLHPLIGFAKKHHIELGLWFSPDSSKDYENWRRDVDTVLSLHKEYGIRHFKIDAVRIRSKTGEQRYHHFLTELMRASGNTIRFELDITADNRYSYLYHREVGSIFVENRYTDWGNYYPHNTLRNLWMLSKYFPARKFQFELLNNTRHKEQYTEDELAPSQYTMDYVFAVTAVANPLFWMEVSSLPEEERVVLRKAVKWYKSCREDFWNGEVFPIGQMPDGQSFTGFHVLCQDGGGYVLIFRESTRESTHSFELPVCCAASTLQLIASNHEGGVDVRLYAQTLTVSIENPRTFALWKYEA